MRYNVVVKRGPFESYEEAKTYAAMISKLDDEHVLSVGVIAATQVEDELARAKTASERRSKGAWWLV